MTKSRYGRILAISTAVCIVLLGILFIACSAHIFFTGGSQPYSRARVGDYLVYLIAPAAATVILIVSGLIYNAITGQKDGSNALRTSSEMLEGFLQRYDFNSFDEETKKEAKSIERTKNIMDFISSEVSALCFVFIIDYFLFIADFSIENLNADVMAAFSVVLPVAAIAIAIHIPRVYIAEKSAEKELALLKESLKAGGVTKVTADKKKSESKIDAAMITRYVIVGSAVALIILGITNGGMADVLQKAIKICTECIGLG